MLKTLITLARGSSARAAERLEDQNALLILDQHIRDAAAALDQARRALAFAAAQDASEERRIATLQADIRDLEQRATAALDTREDLATEAAEAIAGLEIDLAAAQSAHAGFARESARLRQLVRNGERRLTDLERGRRTAQAAEAVRRLRTRGADAGANVRCAARRRGDAGAPAAQSAGTGDRRLGVRRADRRRRRRPAQGEAGEGGLRRPHQAHRRQRARPPQAGAHRTDGGPPSPQAQ